MTTLPTPDQRRRTVLLLEHVERTVLAVLSERPGDRRATEQLRKVRAALARVRDGRRVQ